MLTRPPERYDAIAACARRLLDQGAPSRVLATAAAVVGWDRHMADTLGREARTLALPAKAAP